MTYGPWGEPPESPPPDQSALTPYGSAPYGQVPPGGQVPGAYPGQPYSGYEYPTTPGYSAYPAASMSPQDERMWAMFAHIGGLLVPFAWLIIYIVYKERSQFVRAHAAEAVNFNLSLIIYEFAAFAVSFVIAFITFGFGFLLIFPLLIAFGVFAFVVIIMAAVAANQGRPYRYPMTIRMVN
jgi:uncharacterized Tic20 family protein